MKSVYLKGIGFRRSRTEWNLNDIRLSHFLFILGALTLLFVYTNLLKRNQCLRQAFASLWPNSSKMLARDLPYHLGMETPSCMSGLNALPSCQHSGRCLVLCRLFTAIKLSPCCNRSQHTLHLVKISWLDSKERTIDILIAKVVTSSNLSVISNA